MNAAAGLSPLLAPNTIAVIGASRRKGTIGHQILENLISYGFAGAVFPVNPHARSICAVRAYASIADVPDPVDMAVIVVPKEQVLDIAEQCGRAHVKGLVVISAGFREIGDEGAARETKLMELVRTHGMRMIGPNCMGVVNADPAVSMNATFATAMPPFGHSAFVSQSGALGLSVLDYAQEYGIGISQFVSVGNKPDVSVNDLLVAWEIDPTIKVILMYVENFGNPRRFLEIASRITKVKPIIVVKSGRSHAGALAASSHTGALAVDDVAVDAMLTQAGVLRASSVEELFEMAIGFGARAMPRSRRTAVLTNAGGPGILAADALVMYGLQLADLGTTTIESLRPLFPAEASIRNPLDMIASATPAGYKAALTALLADPAVDAAMPIFVPPFGVRQEDVAEAIASAAATQPTKPVFAVLMGREGLPLGRAELRKAGIPAYIFPESAARALSAINRQVEWAARPAANPAPVDVDRDAAKAILNKAMHDGRKSLTEFESLALLRTYGIPVAESRFASRPEDLAAAGEALGYPLVMKLVSPDVSHKTDVGGVRLGIVSEVQLLEAYHELIRNVRERAPGATVNGVLIQQMVIGGQETIVGISRDPSFGSLVMFGLGGIFVEALQDVIFRMTPIDDAQALEMIKGIQGARVLGGMRGAPPVDHSALATAVRRIAQLGADFPQILELDVNPLLAMERGAVAVDARVLLRAPG
jgi:acetyl coenzyme A synthetase (ADP forming)-like protein